MDGIYTIFYNNFRDHRIIRFTILHEIGHIYLNHLIDFEQTTLKRNGLKDDEYRVLENEANCFARNVLAPYPVVEQLKTDDPIVLSNFFEITEAAAKTRIDLLKNDKHYTKRHFYSKLQYFLKNFLDLLSNKFQCNTCGYISTKHKPNTCQICGKKEIKRLPFYLEVKLDMIYKSYTLDNNGRALKCPRCDNEELEYQKECKICFSPIINECAETQHDFSDYRSSCGSILTGNARFCECGNESTFKQADLFLPWEQEKVEYEKKLQEERYRQENPF